MHGHEQDEGKCILYNFRLVVMSSLKYLANCKNRYDSFNKQITVLTELFFATFMFPLSLCPKTNFTQTSLESKSDLFCDMSVTNSLRNGTEWFRNRFLRIVFI